MTTVEIARCPHGCKPELSWAEDQWICLSCGAEWADEVINPPKPRWLFNDGGRAEAGYKGSAGDCAARSIAIVSGLAYQTVYDEINEWAKSERPRVASRRSNARTGVQRTLLRRWLPTIGFIWVPTMEIGVGTVVHVRPEELPPGRLILACSKHYTAMIDGVVHDTHDPSRDGTRAVYGYYQLET